jgi:hypothetical protein
MVKRGNYENDIPLDSYWKSATFLYSNLLQILNGVILILWKRAQHTILPKFRLEKNHRRSHPCQIPSLPPSAVVALAIGQRPHDFAGSQCSRDLAQLPLAAARSHPPRLRSPLVDPVLPSVQVISPPSASSSAPVSTSSSCSSASHLLLGPRRPRHVWLRLRRRADEDELTRAALVNGTCTVPRLPLSLLWAAALAGASSRTQNRHSCLALLSFSCVEHSSSCSISLPRAGTHTHLLLLSFCSVPLCSAAGSLVAFYLQLLFLYFSTLCSGKLSQ